jgi:hypothetical protein
MDDRGHIDVLGVKACRETASSFDHDQSWRAHGDHAGANAVPALGAR